MSRLPASLATIAFGSLSLWLALSLNAWRVIGRDFGYLDGGVYPLVPTQQVTQTSLAFDAAISILLFAPAALFAALSAYKTRRWLMLPGLWVASFFLGAATIAHKFQIDFGTTFAPHEAVLTVFYRTPVTMPLMIGGAAICTLAAHRWLAPHSQNQP